MTQETFVKTLKSILLESKEISWNNVLSSFVTGLGREYADGSLKGEEIASRLQSVLPYQVNRHMREKIIRTFRH